MHPRKNASMVSLLVQMNATSNKISSLMHPDHTLFIRRFLEYHPDKKPNTCFLDGVLAPAVDPTRLRCVSVTQRRDIEATIADYEDAEGRLFALVHPDATDAWLRHVDYLYVTHVSVEEDPHATILAAPIEQQFVKLGGWSWGQSSRSVWFRRRPPPPQAPPAEGP